MILHIAAQVFEAPAHGAFSVPTLGAEPDMVVDALLEQLRGQQIDPGWVPAAAGLVNNLTLAENCLLPLEWRRWLTQSELERRCDAALQMLGTSLSEAGWLRQRPSQASRMQVRQALALRILLVEPAVVVLGPGALQGRCGDEPWASCWSRWLPESLLLAVGETPEWPPLPSAGAPGNAVV